MSPQTHLSYHDITVNKLRNKEWSIQNDYVASEEPLQIEVIGQPLTITMRTPGDDKALALGFIFTEGLIPGFDAIGDIVQKDDNTVNILPDKGFAIESGSVERSFYGTSSCGVCGKTSVESVYTRSLYMPSENTSEISQEVLKGLQDKLRSVQSTFELTGGLHACALFDTAGHYLYHSEDVGRHNACDKMIGHAVMAGRCPLDQHILLLSGRASFELVQKASMAGIPVICAVGAPSSLAVELAEKNNQTLVGFLKNSGFNVYTGAHRIK